MDRRLPEAAMPAAAAFRSCLPMRVKLHEVMRLLEDREIKAGLDFGAPNPMMSYYLRRRGGTWSTMTNDPGAQATAETLLGTGVYSYVGGRLPFDDKSFDVVVVFDGLERVADDEGLIAEWHRVLRSDGILVLNVRNRKQLSLIRWLSGLWKGAVRDGDRLREGYSESELFAALKDGFDVFAVRSYSRFLVELVDLFVGRALRSGTGGRALPRMLASFFYRLAFQLDVILLFLRGHNLIARAKRRAWRPRKTPVLVDGRSISTAVLSKPGV